MIEVKCFADERLDTDEFYRAVGQYQLYENALRFRQENYPLYLTIPQVAYERFKKRPEIMMTLRTAQIKSVIINLEQEEIVEWIPMQSSNN